MITTAFIHLWNKRVGAIAWDASNRLASFEYDPSFLNNNWNIAPLTLSLSCGVQPLLKDYQVCWPMCCPINMETT